MMTAKVYENGGSQEVTLPKEYHFSSDEIMVHKIGDVVLLFSKTNKWDSFMTGIEMFSDDFMEDGPAKDLIQDRERF